MLRVVYCTNNKLVKDLREIVARERLNESTSAVTSFGLFTEAASLRVASCLDQTKNRKKGSHFVAPLFASSDELV